MRLELATQNDFDAIIAFYDDVTERTPEMATYASDWSQQVPDEKVAVIHILAVSPGYQGKGIGSEMIREAIRMAKSKGMQAIRLDALASNTPAHKLYKRLGFEYRGKQHLYAENTGWTDFYFFEYKNK